MAKKQLIICSLLVLIYFIFTTIIISFPLVLHIKDYIFEKVDELLITWIMNWDIYALLHTPLHIYQANIFYPYINSLTYSDTFFTNALIAFLPVKLLGEPIVAFNINYLIAHSMLGFFTFLLVRYISKSIPAGVISGTLMTFSTYTVTRYIHLQLLSTQWIPLALLFFFLFIDKKQIRYFVCCGIAFLLQAANSFQPAYFLGYTLIISSIYFYIQEKNNFRKTITKQTIVIFSITALIFLLLGIPYLQTSIKYNYTRDIRDTINFANRPEYILFPSDRTRLHDLLLNTFYKHDTSPRQHDGYLGLMVIVLGIFAVIYRIIRRKRFKIKYFDLFLFLAISAYVISLGPALQWRGHVIKHPFLIPLPYAIFYYLVPGFKGFRNSARWELLVVFSLSVLIGLLFAYLLKKSSKKQVWLITGIICFLVLAEIQFPFHYQTVPRTTAYPLVYRYIASLPANVAIIELPIYNWNMSNAAQENIRLLYSTSHYKAMVNGTSGFSPPEWQKEVEYMDYYFPNIQTLQYLKKIKVKYAMIHSSEYSELFNKNQFVHSDGVKSWKQLKNIIDQTSRLHLVKIFGKDFVYEIQ